MTWKKAISTISILTLGINSVPCAAAVRTKCDIASASLLDISNKQRVILSDYMKCVSSINGQYIASPFPRFGCYFEAKQAERGQNKLASAAEFANHICENFDNEIPTSPVNRSPLNILPTEFMPEMVANHRTIDKRFTLLRGGSRKLVDTR